ncbi:MAG: hypothetical protein WD081_01360 [Gammaproteobacteria bacterium]
MNDTSPPRRGRLMLVGLAAFFILPLVAAWWMYASVEAVPDTEVVSHGTLIRPARPLGDFELAGIAENGRLTDEALHGRWAIVYVGGSDCDRTCVDTLWEARQVHTRLGRDASRIQRVYLLAHADAVADPAFFAREHAGMLLARADDGLLTQFTVGGEAPVGQVFLVDPLGNLMMRYTADAPPEALYDDLKRLLRISRIG